MGFSGWTRPKRGTRGASRPPLRKNRQAETGRRQAERMIGRCELFQGSTVTDWTARTYELEGTQRPSKPQPGETETREALASVQRIRLLDPARVKASSVPVQQAQPPPSVGAIERRGP